MKPIESELSVFSKAQEMIDKGRFSRAQQIISRYLMSNREKPCIALKSLDALCFYELGDSDKALLLAENLICTYKNHFSDLLSIQIIAFIFRGRGLHDFNSIMLLSQMYEGGWKNISSVHLGEKYCATQILCGNFTDFRHTGTQLFRISKDSKHKLWSVLGNCLNDESKYIRSLGMTVLWKFLYQTSTNSTEISSKEWKKLLSFYMFNFLRDCAVEKYTETFTQLVHDVISLIVAIKDAPPSEILLGWAIVRLIDVFLDDPLLFSNFDCGTPSVLCISLLDSDLLVQEALSSNSVNPRKNFKYFRFLLQRNSEVALSQIEVKILGMIRQYICVRSSQPDELNFTCNEKINLSSRISKVPCCDGRMKSLINAYQSIHNFDGHEWRAAVDSLLEFCTKYHDINEWACFRDTWPLAGALIKKVHGSIEKRLCTEQFLRGLQLLPYLHLLMIITILIEIPESLDSGSSHQRISSSLEYLTAVSHRSCFGDYVMAQALVFENEALLALMVLHYSHNKSELNRLISIFIAGKLDLLDDQALMNEKPFNNIQHDTMSYIYFDALIDGYYHEHLRQVCCDSLEFYRSTTGPDALQLIESALNNAEWLMIQQEIPQVVRKLKYSLRRMECVIWHVLCSIEPMTTESALHYLAKWNNHIEGVHQILKAEKNCICANDDRTILGDCISNRLKGRSDDERIEELLQITSFLRCMTESSGLEWHHTDCFGVKKLSHQDSLKSPLSFDSVEARAIRRLGFPGLSLLMCSLQRELHRDAEVCVKNLAIVRQAVENCHRYISVEIEENKAVSFHKDNLKSLLDSVVPDISAAMKSYSRLRQDKLLRWRKVFDRRRKEIHLFLEQARKE